MTITQSQQPEALRLADVLEKMPGYDWNKTYCEAAFQLRHIQHQNECLTAENEALKSKLARSGLERHKAVQDAVSDAVAAEREACAELMEQQHTWITNVAASALIRARGMP